MLRYWIAGAPGNWTDTANWSTSSGGAGGASIPIIDTTAVFDSNGLGTCTLDASAWIRGLQFSSGFTGIFNQNSNEMLIGSVGGSFLDGIFQGSGNDIRVAGDLFIGGACQFQNTDTTLGFDSTFIYSPTTGSFTHNNGLVSMDGTQANLDASGYSFYRLQFNTYDGRLNSSCFVEDTLYLQSGYVGQGVIGSEVHLLNDLSCGTNYNEWGEGNNLNLIFDGTDKQVLYNELGSVLPTIIINKTDSCVICGEESIYVTCEGDSPIVMRGNFLVNDGTFNMNNHDIQVGI